MNELVLLPSEEIIDQRGGDFGTGFAKTSGNCVITNQRLVVCSLTKPRDVVNGAVAGVCAKLLLGTGADLLVQGVTLAQALKSQKPLYPVFEQPLDNLTRIKPWRWGLGCGVDIQTPKVSKFSVKLGLGRTRDAWMVTLSDAIQKNCPNVLVARSSDGLTMTKRDRSE